MSFWDHLDARPNYIIVENLTLISILKYTTNNYTYVFPVIFIHSPKHDFLEPVRKSKGICYNNWSQVSERGTFSIPYDHVLVSQWFLG